LSAPDSTLAAASEGPEDFLSGQSGTVGGIDGLRRAALDRRDEAWERLSGRRRRLDRAARSAPPRRRVLVLGAWRPEHRALTDPLRSELTGTRHDVTLHVRAPSGQGKFETLNLLLAELVPEEHDWLIVIDDDVSLPRNFLDRLLFLCERFALDLAQPAHPRNSHAAWELTRRRSGTVLRETAFVEIGPVTALARATFSTLLPFPALRMGWGLDAHWAALARERHWRCGVVDAVCVRHRRAPAASAYSREAAIDEARRFLAVHPYLPASESQRTLASHSSW